MVTQRDVADRAGVSTTTVSHVINETRFVSEDLRERVRRAMEELDYQPNVVARNLRRQRTHCIGVIVPDLAYPFLAEVARGIEDGGFSLGYNAIVCATRGDPKKEQSCFDLALTKQVDGVILVSGGEDNQHLEALLDREVPVVICGREQPRADVATVTVDNEDCGVQATNYVISLGHQRIGCITGPAGLTVSEQRTEGYRRALGDADISFQQELVARGDFRNRGGFEAMNQLLDLGQPPEAVFACNDLMAMGAICAASKRRLQIPQEVAIIGCDDIALAAFTNPSLTTVRLPKYQLGFAAVQRLVARIEDERVDVDRHTLPVELVIRDSC